MRVVICRNKQLTRLLHTCRTGIESNIASQNIDSLIEDTTAQLILQLTVVEQSVLGNILIVRRARSHRKRTHSIGLVARTQVAIGQVVRCILCQHIVRTTRLTQIRQSLGIHRLTLERVTHNIVLQAAHLATRRLVGIHILHRASKVIKLKPRLGHHTANLHGLLLGGVLHQRIATIHHSAIVATLEVNLHQVVRHQIAVDSTLCQSRETIASHVKLTTRIGHI